LAYLLIAFVLFVALAPLSHFVPSKRQRRIARLRERAAMGGLFVEFRKPIEAALRRLDRDQPGEPIYYGKRLPTGNPVLQKAWWVREDGLWRPLDHRIAVPEHLSEMPADVFAASVDSGSCGIYWLEAGEDLEVDIIGAGLGVWAASLQEQNSDFP